MHQNKISRFVFDPNKTAAKYLILLEAGTGIEPVYTDLQSAA